LLGGGDGATNQTVIERAGKQETLPGKFSHLLVHPGETVTFLTAGGGGYGQPEKRAAVAIKRDIDLGYLSEARGRQDYPAALCPKFSKTIEQ
jgi:N-methylhydantoinase B